VTYQQILEKLNRLREIVKQVRIDNTIKDHAAARKAWEEAQLLYGSLDEVILRFAGIRAVTAKEAGGNTAEYRNYIEAMMFSPFVYFDSQGYAELLKVVGKVQQQVSDPTLPLAARSVTDVVQILSRFRECCQYETNPPQCEKDVQDIMWIMLRPHFDGLEREEALPKFGVKGYRPDFGIPDHGILVEAKFIGGSTNVADVQQGILADIPGYLQENSKFSGVVVLVYDQAQKLRDDRKFKEDLLKVAGILNVQVIPGIG
jgi:hypothetical protein